MSTPAALLEQFFSRQKDRVTEYNLLHDSFQTMISTKSETTFLQSIPERTQHFAAISREIIEIVKKLLHLGDGTSMECVKWIRTIQNAERMKLKATGELQALKKAFEFKEANWGESRLWTVGDPEEGFRIQMHLIVTELDSAIEQINDALDELRCIKLDMEGGSP